VGSLKGIGAACIALDMPIVSGNVSLYNETDGKGILPTPTIGAVGILTDVAQLIGGQPVAGDVAVVIGQTLGHLGQSALMAEAFGIEAGAPPPVDLTDEKRHGDFIRAHGAAFHACTDLSDGGLALAAFEMAEGADLGLTLTSGDVAQLFGEDQARYLVALPATAAATVLAKAAALGLPAAIVGGFGGSAVNLGTETRPLADLSMLYRSAFAAAVG
jgi:phosphoribosylformylglycinamidine synthase subunit PurL